MIRSALRLFRGLSGYHYRTIIITMLLPAIVPAVIAYFAPDTLVLRVIFYVAAFLVWSVLAVLAVASMLKRDISGAEQLVDHKLEAPSSQISRLREEREDLGADLRQQVKDLEETVRTTLKEELRVDLRPRRISLRAKPMHFSLGASAANVTVVGGSKVARLLQWCRRAMRWLWEVVYGKPDDC